ncbi:hypothetical protein BDF19DRAFT_421897 [Syncephalis fuscata]|nr:hypothetical protein BDF19DRAFT_421897 [Syncephalis fuscata]
MSTTDIFAIEQLPNSETLSANGVEISQTTPPTTFTTTTTTTDSLIDQSGDTSTNLTIFSTAAVESTSILDKEEEITDAVSTLQSSYNINIDNTPSVSDPTTTIDVDIQDKGNHSNKKQLFGTSHRSNSYNDALHGDSYHNTDSNSINREDENDSGSEFTHESRQHFKRSYFTGTPSSTADMDYSFRHKESKLTEDELERRKRRRSLPRFTSSSSKQRVGLSKSLDNDSIILSNLLTQTLQCQRDIMSMQERWRKEMISFQRQQMESYQKRDEQFFELMQSMHLTQMRLYEERETKSERRWQSFTAQQSKMYKDFVEAVIANKQDAILLSALNADI